MESSAEKTNIGEERGRRGGEGREKRGKRSKCKAKSQIHAK
jgi:hypothetical protein